MLTSFRTLLHVKNRRERAMTTEISKGVDRSALPDNLKYSKWDHIEVSDDEGDSHPNIDQKLMARLKKEKRAHDYEEFRKKHPDAPDPIRAEELATSKERTLVNSSKKETEEQKQAAAKKDEGNKHFAKSEYPEAEACFTEAIALTAFVDELQPPNMEARKQRAVFFNNRAAARSNQNKHEEAIEDTTAAIKLDYRYVKARLCRAKTYETLGKVKEAFDDYKRAMSYEPNNATARGGVDRLQPAVDALEEEKLFEITIPDEIPEDRVISYEVPGKGKVLLELPEDAVPGQTIKLQMEEADEEGGEEEEDGGGGLHKHADLYQQSLKCYFKDPMLNQIFMDRWHKMPDESRLAVVDRTFDVMVQQTITNTSGYKMSKQALYLLCPEINPESRRTMSKQPDAFIKACNKASEDTDAKAQEWLESQREKLKEVQIAFGIRLQYQISVETDGGLEVMAPIRRLLVAETLVCVFEALTGKKASEMPHMAGHI